MTVWRDDLGTPVELAAPARRVVSLVPSLTEAVARSAPGLLVGATDWCTHPVGLSVTRVRGTKNPERACCPPRARLFAARPSCVPVESIALLAGHDSRATAAQGWTSMR